MTQRRSIDRSLISGIAWTGGARWVVQAASWASTIVVARLLSPDDYGLVGMAMVYLGLVHLVNEFGLGAAVVQNRKLSDVQIGQLGFLSVVLGLLFFGVSVGLAGTIARAFSEGRLTQIIVVASVAYPIGGLRLMPRALLTRDRNFRVLALIDAGESAVQIVATILLAFFGFGFWALVLGTLVARFTACIATITARPLRIVVDFKFGKVKETVVFGWHMVTANFAFYAYTSGDSAIIGRFLGTEQLGFYSMGSTLGSTPTSKIYEVLSRVMPSILSASQDEPGELRRYVLNLSAGIALLTFPMGVGMWLVSENFLMVLLGQTWLPAAAPLGILALSSTFRSLSPLFVQVLVATGRPELNARTTAAQAIILLPLFFVVKSYGIAAIATVWLVASPLTILFTSMRWALKTMECRFGTYLAYLWPAFSSTLVMAAAVVMVRLLAISIPDGLATLTLDVVVGALSYSAALLLFHGTTVARYRNIIVGLRRKT